MECCDPEHTVTERIAMHAREFSRQGFTIVPGALSAEQADVLLAQVTKEFERPDDEGYGPIIRVRMFERGEIFEDLMEQPFIIDLVENILGDNIHVIAMSALKTPRDTGIDWWHVDDDLFFPLPDGVEWDPRVEVPIYLLTCMYYLVDVTEEMGPTQIVPGSHRSGRHPNPDQDPPIYNGSGPVSVLAKKGDCMLFFGQTWHRGSRNQSDDARIVQQVVYGRRWISQRLYPFVNYQLPHEVMERAKDHPRRTRLLGMHRRGAYG